LALSDRRYRIHARKKQETHSTEHTATHEASAAGMTTGSKPA